VSEHPLDDWVRVTAPRAVAYARSLLRNPHDAEEIVQDCYGRLLAKAGVYDLPRDGMKLLLTAVSNACLNLKSRQRTFFRLVRSEEGEDAIDDPPDRTAATPVQEAGGKELAAAVAIALRKLPPLQRAAIELKSLGHSQQEIGEILNVTSNNAGVLVHRARQSLADHLAPFLGDGDAP
jgi:RNA polymerase sigma-70 factor, ECF subfamily